MDVSLEKFLSEDFAHYFKLVSDIKVMEMITERAIGLNEAQTDYEKLIQNNQLAQNFGSFKILDFETNEFIGLAKLEIDKKRFDKAELGYIILPEYWGKGIASMVAKKLIEIAKTHNTLKELFAIIDPKNIPSRKILVKNGFLSKEFKDFDGLPGEILKLKL